MHQLRKLFGKLDLVSQQKQTKQSTDSKRVAGKLQRVSISLWKTTRKLDHMAGDFDPRESDETGYQAA